MTPADTEAIARVVGAVVKEFVAAELAPLVARIAALETKSSTAKKENDRA